MSAKRTKRADKPRRGRADLKRVRQMTEAEISRSSPIELVDIPDDFWDQAEMVSPPTKEAISLRVDRDVLEWFRAKGPRYQTRINAVLRSYMTSVQRRRPRTRKPASDED